MENESTNTELQSNELKQPIICTVYITEDDMKALVRIRNYFGENDKTQLEHLAYDVLDRVVNPF